MKFLCAESSSRTIAPKQTHTFIDNDQFHHRLQRNVYHIGTFTIAIRTPVSGEIGTECTLIYLISLGEKRECGESEGEMIQLRCTDLLQPLDCKRDIVGISGWVMLVKTSCDVVSATLLVAGSRAIPPENPNL
jgi:hypothetical protein